jgi:presenilin-like A22 family membrane protease
LVVLATAALCLSVEAAAAAAVAVATPTEFEERVAVLDSGVFFVLLWWLGRIVFLVACNDGGRCFEAEEEEE